MEKVNIGHLLFSFYLYREEPQNVLFCRWRNRDAKGLSSIFLALLIHHLQCPVVYVIMQILPTIRYSKSITKLSWGRSLIVREEKEKEGECQNWVSHASSCQSQPVPLPRSQSQPGAHSLQPWPLYPGGREARIHQLLLFQEAKSQGIFTG